MKKPKITRASWCGACGTCGLCGLAGGAIFVAAAACLVSLY